MRIDGFDILGKLGEGGMAAVWKARQVSLDRMVAIKTLSAQMASDPEDVARFRSEAQSAAKLKHPGIVQVYDCSTQEDFYYFVMEFIDGYTVGQWMSRSGPLTETDALLIAECVAKALHYAWEKEGLIHCDIKPDNIMVDADGTVKVADLGLARSIRLMSGEEKTVEILGTPVFMSPEQARGEVELDCRSDIYSLGATLYYLVTGKLLFEGRTDEQAIDLQSDGSVENPANLNPKLSRGLCKLIEVMLAKSAEDRPQTWGEVLRDIRRVKRKMFPLCLLKAGRPSTVEPGQTQLIPKPDAPRSYPDRFAPPPQGNSRVKWIVAVGFLAILFALFAFSRFRDPSKRPPPFPPPPAETPNPPGNGAPAATPEHQAAQKIFEYARQWAEDHPDEYDAAIDKLREAARQTRGTPYAEQAVRKMQDIRERRKSALDEVMLALRKTVDPHLQKHKYREAADIYRNYSGAWSAETRERRDLVVRRLAELEREWIAERQSRAEKARTLYDKTLLSVANALLEKGFDEALNKANAYLKSNAPTAHKDSMRRVRVAVQDAIGAERRILQSFREGLGQEIMVEMRTGRVRVAVTAVVADQVRGHEIKQVGSARIRSAISFGLTDLSLREKLMRMGKDADAGVGLLKGRMAYETQATEHARKLFRSVPKPLGPVLLQAMENQQVRQKENQARDEWNQIMTRFAVKAPESAGAEDWTAALRETSFSANDLGLLRNAITLFDRKHGKTEFARQNAAALAEIAKLQAAPEEQAEAAPERGLVRPRDLQPVTEWNDHLHIMGEWQNRNPGLSVANDVSGYADQEGRLRMLEIFSEKLISLEPLGKLTDLRILHCGGVPFRQRQRNDSVAPLDDLAPLKGLSLQELYIGQTAVQDLAPLRDMPLRALYAGGTKIRHLDPLRRMPLDVLDIQRTAVRNLMPLRGLSLRELNIAGTPVSQVLDLTRMPLNDLNISKTQVHNIDPLKGMPLSQLNLAETKVSRFDVLADFPLRHFNASSTQFRNMDLLREKRLVGLHLDGTSIADIDALRGMPLRTLNIGRTAVRDLRPLAGCELNYLNLDRTRIPDLSALNLFSVQHLSLRGVNVDLAPLVPSSVRSLHIDRPQKHLALLRNMKNLQQVNGMTLTELLEHIRLRRQP
jgi:serine/threonine protein kinase